MTSEGLGLVERQAQMLRLRTGGFVRYWAREKWDVMDPPAGPQHSLGGGGGKGSSCRVRRSLGVNEWVTTGDQGCWPGVESP